VKIMRKLKIEEGNKLCKAMHGLIEESEEVIKNFPSGLVRDSALVMAAQKIEHYEIASYNSLCDLAEVLGLDTAYDDLVMILQEEQDTDQLLISIGKDINEEACES
jgi:ferritin-like metal-binding protein YciE